MDLGFIVIPWYGVMYIAAFVVFYLLGRLRAGPDQLMQNGAMVSDLLFYGGFGVIVGGRLGYILLYAHEQFLNEPTILFRLWEGGMSFHGGLVGVLIASFVWARLRKIPYLPVMDFVAPLVPIGIGLGRIGNFINTELPGRVTEFALGVHFPCSAVRHYNLLCVTEWESVTRHISSLYQAFAEGVVLFVVMWVFSSRPRQIGMVSGMFLICAGVIRIVTEFFREPDVGIGFILFESITFGQVLSVPVILGGIVLVLPLSRRRIGLAHNN